MYMHIHAYMHIYVCMYVCIYPWIKNVDYESSKREEHIVSLILKHYLIWSGT